MRLTSETGAAQVTHAGDTHTPVEGTDNVFDLPNDLALHLVRLPGWRETTDDDLPDDEAAPAPRRRGGRRRTS